MFLATDSISPKVKSAHDSCNTPGVFDTSTPCFVASSMSILSIPTARLATTLSLGDWSSNSLSTRSVISVIRPSLSRAFRRTTSLGGADRSCHAPTSQNCFRCVMASGIMCSRVTKLFYSTPSSPKPIKLFNTSKGVSARYCNCTHPFSVDDAKTPEVVSSNTGDASVNKTAVGTLAHPPPGTANAAPL